MTRFENYNTHKLPDNWEWTEISNVGDIVLGTTPSKSNEKYYGDDYPFYKPTSLNSGYYTKNAKDGLSKMGMKEARYLPPKSTLVTCIGSTIGKIGFIRKGGASNQQIIAIVPSEDMVPEFIYFATKSPFFQRNIDAKKSATTTPILNKTKFSKLPIPVPPYEEQKRIVTKVEELISKLDSGIDEMQRVKLQLTRYWLSLLKTAFEGNLSSEARITNEWKITQKLESPDEIPNLIKIPSVWQWVEANEIIGSLRNGIYKPKKYYNDDGIACLRMYNIDDGQIVWKDIKQMELTDEEYQKYRLEPGDLLVNRVNSRKLVGKAAPIPESIEECVFESKNIRIKPNEYVSGEFLGHWFHLFRKHYFMSQVKQTVGQASITQTQIKDMPVPLPPIDEQNVILDELDRQDSILSNIDEKIHDNLTRANRLRQSILKQAFEGKLAPQSNTEKFPKSTEEKIEDGEQKRLSEVINDVK